MEPQVDKQRILIVEDDLDLAEMLDAYFRVQNYDVLTAAWGEDGLRIAGDEALNLVVLDIRLPDMSGYDVCRQLRAQRRTADVPIIFLTEKRDRVDKLQGLELGVVDYITKPFDIQELRLRVRNAITRAERQAHVNPVTDLPDEAQVNDKLATLLYDEKPWAVLLVSIMGLEDVRDVYGFVASDEVLRAVTLMLRNAVRELGTEEDFIGHMDQHQIAIFTAEDRVAAITERLDTRLRPSLQHFYAPTASETGEPDYLTLVTRSVTHSSGPFNDVDEIKQRLNTDQAQQV
jgi:PleD family two-component response regulator